MADRGDDIEISEREGVEKAGDGAFASHVAVVDIGRRPPLDRSMSDERRVWDDAVQSAPSRRSVVVIGVAVAAFVIFCLALQVTSTRVLIWQNSIPAGELPTEPGRLASSASQDSLVCNYFTGRSVQKELYWDSRDGLIGVDECPFIYNASPDR